MRHTLVGIAAGLVFAAAAIPAFAQLGVGSGNAPAASAPSGGGSGGAASSSGGRSSGGGGGGTVGRSGGGVASGGNAGPRGGNWSGRGGNWAGRNGNWAGRNQRFVRHRSGSLFSFGFAEPDYESCGYVRVKHYVRHRAVWRVVYRCY
jgi:hypothetical protein